MKAFFGKGADTATELRIVGVLAFVFVAILIVFCAFLMNVGLGIQRDMLQASSISYEQRIFIESVGKRLLFLMKNLSKADVLDHSVNDIREDIYALNRKINDNQQELKSTFPRFNDYFVFGEEYFDHDIAERLEEIDLLLKKLDARIEQINNATLPVLRSAYNFWSPVDVLVADNGKLPEAMAILNNSINRASLRQNKLLYFLYEILLILMLIGIWVIWYFTLRPLSYRLDRNYQEIQRKNDSLAFQAQHDNLTSLPNRAQFISKMNQLFEKNKSPDNIALMLVDIDNFKSINDNYGHHAGDNVLVEFSGRLSANLKEGEVLYRLSGDEFAIIVTEVEGREYVTERAHSMILSLREKYTLFERDFPVHGSIGIAYGEYCGASLQELFSAADMALYHVKDNGRNHFVFYDDISDLKISEMLEIEQELYKGIDNKEFTVYYQPIIDLRDGSIARVEALVRWQHPEKGLLLPDQWLSIAERLSIFSNINMQVFDIVEKDFTSWRAEGLNCPTIFINITESLLLSGMGFERIKSMLHKTSSPVPWLAIEVTESVILDRSFNLALHQMQLLQQAGIKIALDDFGTGFANLSHLNSIPFDTIKIDRSFVSQILVDHNMKMIVEAIIKLVTNLEKEIICEGVDSQEIKAAIAKMGCCFSQGYLHSHPLSFEDMGHLLRN